MITALDKNTALVLIDLQQGIVNMKTVPPSSAIVNDAAKLAGIATSIGVESTARSANELGYTITFAEDVMTDLVPDAHKNSLKIIFPRIGEIGNTETIPALLSQRS